MSKKTLEELAALLDFVKADLAGIEADYEDPFVEQLQNSVRRIKKSRKMGERYMMFEQYMQEPFHAVCFVCEFRKKSASYLNEPLCLNGEIYL